MDESRRKTRTLRGGGWLPPACWLTAAVLLGSACVEDEEGAPEAVEATADVGETEKDDVQAMPRAAEQASEAPADGVSCVGEAPPPTLSVAPTLELPADAPAIAQPGGVSVLVRNEDSSGIPVEVTAIVDFGTMQSRKIPLAAEWLDPGEVAQVTFDFAPHAKELGKMRFSGMLRFVARRVDTGEWVGTEPVFFHPPAPGKEPLLYREAVLMEKFRAGDFRGELAAWVLDEPGVVTTRTLDASAAPVYDDDGLEPDLAPEVAP